MKTLAVLSLLAVNVIAEVTAEARLAIRNGAVGKYIYRIVDDDGASVSSPMGGTEAATTRVENHNLNDPDYRMAFAEWALSVASDGEIFNNNSVRDYFAAVTNQLLNAAQPLPEVEALRGL